jgi:hypothetical protein
MTRDYGGQDRPVWRAGRRLEFITWYGGRGGLFIAFVIFAALPTLVAISPIGPSLLPAKHRPFTPRPCQPITEAVFERGWKDDPRTFSFLGVTFARRRGDADCQGRKGFFEKVYWPVCEFDVPFQLAVARGGRTLYYAVPAGYTAVVDARPDAATRCYVTGANEITLRLASEAGP